MRVLRIELTSSDLVADTFPAEPSCPPLSLIVHILRHILSLCGMHACMHACLYIYVFVLGVHLPTYVMWKPEVNAGSLPRSLSTLILETRSLAELGACYWLYWVARGPLGCACLCPQWL